MAWCRIALVVFLASLAAGCGCGSSSTPGDAGPADAAATGDAADLPFGADCTDNTQCASGVCIQFGQGRWCTLACTDASQCPVGSQGQKCNLQGYCRP